MAGRREAADLLDAVSCAFVAFADDGRVLAVNRTLCALVGKREEAVVGRHVESLLTVGSRIFYQTHFFPLLKLHGHVQEIYLALQGDGHDVPALVNAVRRQDGDEATTDCVLMPMKQRNEYEERILEARRAAEEAARAKDQFLAVMSHELRTPLTAIVGWARLMRTGKLDAATAERAVEAIERNADAQSTLIEDLLDLSRITTGRLRLDVTAVDLAGVAEAALDVVRPAAQAKGVRLVASLDPRAGPVSGDASRLQQVLWNLLANAVKFTPKGGQVQLRLHRVNSSAEIVVADTGRGIPADFLPFVFERFRQADDKAREQGGLGLGLAISRHLVELHGGTIRAESPGPGEGATFAVRLPVMIAHARPGDAPAAVAEAVEAAPRLDGVRVLVVEDEPDARDLIVTILEQAGASVAAAGNVDEALAALETQRPDLLLSDIQLPGEDGCALVRRVRAMEGAAAGIPAIALTAHAKPADRMQALRAGFQVHMGKPVEPAELVVAIANLAAPRS
ncbi:MAG TPA: ATP-binding protein [Casimicrobiaceae bacterium]|nr:ATP-binding protein [Casimicrobiaceae bacterium]